MRTVAEHVNTSLKQSRQELKFFALIFRESKLSTYDLSSFTSYSQTIQTVYLLDQSGRVVRASPQQAEQRQKYHGALESASIQERLYLTPPYSSNYHQEIVVGMVQPGSGNRMLLAELDLRALQNSLQRLTHHMVSDSIILTDASGNLLAHPDMERINQRTNIGNRKIISSMNDKEIGSEFFQRNGAMHFMSATEIQISN